MNEHERIYSVVTMCRVLVVPRSGYYGWRGRPPAARTIEDAYLTDTIKDVHEESRQVYGSPRIHADFAEVGARVGCKRGARLMREADLLVERFRLM